MNHRSAFWRLPQNALDVSVTPSARSGEACLDFTDRTVDRWPKKLPLLDHKSPRNQYLHVHQRDSARHDPQPWTETSMRKTEATKKLLKAEQKDEKSVAWRWSPKKRYLLTTLNRQFGLLASGFTSNTLARICSPGWKRKGPWEGNPSSNSWRKHEEIHHLQTTQGPIQPRPPERPKSRSSPHPPRHRQDSRFGPRCPSPSLLPHRSHRLQVSWMLHVAIMAPLLKFLESFTG